MINFYRAKNFCKEDISLIENFEKAAADLGQTWDCHHRRENISSRKELIKIGEYFNRPARELIFLTKSEHIALHNKGNKNMLGKHHSYEAKRKIAAAKIGKHHSYETKLKMSEATKYNNIGRCWFNNGIKNVFSRECPEGFVKGMLKRKAI